MLWYQVVTSQILNSQNDLQTTKLVLSTPEMDKMMNFKWFLNNNNNNNNNNNVETYYKEVDILW